MVAMMNRSGAWSLSPAFDMTYRFNPSGAWTNTHQMSMNGKRDQFAHDDFTACAKLVSMKRGRADEILEQVHDAAVNWPQFADQADVDTESIGKISTAQRTDILS